MPSPRILPIPSRVVLVLDRLVGIGWLFLAVATSPIVYFLVEPSGLLLDLLHAPGGWSEPGVIVDTIRTDAREGTAAIWRSEVALIAHDSVRGVGYSVGQRFAIGDEVPAECTLLGCDTIRPAGTRSSMVGPGWSLTALLGGLALVGLPLRSLWRRRWWIAALCRGTVARGWVEKEGDTEQAVQWVEVQYDDEHDARWFRRCWLGHRGGSIHGRLRVLYLPRSPLRSVVLEELPGWMGRQIPAAGHAWPLPSPAAWGRVLGGLGVLVAWGALFWHIMG